ncbi:MAG: Gfo/Idh/MocA family oxidoreductase [Victivallales bacterium]
MGKTIRAAIIGIGKSTQGKGGGHSFSYCHGWAYTSTPGMELVAACSRSEQNVSDFLKEFPGCLGFQDYRRMLKESKPDLVSVCAFAPDREEMVKAAMEAGAKGIWIEKPFALTLGAARRMMEAASKKGTRLFVNHQRRYGKPFEWLRDAAADGRIGEVLSFDVAQPFGDILVFGPHLVDAALFTLGAERKVETVFGAVDWSGAHDWQGAQQEGQFLGSVHFNDGTRLTIEAGKHICKKLPILRVNGSLGFAEVHLQPASDAGSVFRARFAGETGISSPSTNEHFHHSEDPALYMKRAARDVLAALQSGTPTRIDAEEGYRGLEIMLGIYESARQQRMLAPPFEINEPPSPPIK